MTTFDLRDTIIPFSLLQINNCFKRMKAGEILDILFCDKHIEDDLKRILPRHQYEIIFPENLKTGRNEFSIRLRRIDCGEASINPLNESKEKK